LWADIQRGRSKFAAEEIVRHVCEAILSPLDFGKAVHSLADAGDFEAAQLLLDSAPVDLQEPARQEQVARYLVTARNTAVAAIRERVHLLRQRAERVGDVEPRMEQSFRSAVERAQEQVVEADALLKEVEDALATAEAREEQELMEQLHARRSHGEPLATLVEVVESAIRSHDFDVSRWLLSATTTNDMEVRPIPPRRLWTFAKEPSATVLGWFRGDVEGSPPGEFLRDWSIPADDLTGWRFLEAFAPFVESRPHSPAELVELIAALGEALEAGDQPEPAIEQAGSTLWGFVPGLRQPGFYMFSAAEYDQGVPLVVTDQADRADEGSAEAPEGDEEIWSDAPDSEPVQPLDGYYLQLGAHPERSPAENAIVLRPETFFRFAGDPCRAVNLAREVASQFPPATAFPRPLPPNDGRFVVGREEEERALAEWNTPLLITSPPGGGRSTMLRRVEFLARRQGWNVISLRPVFGPGGAWNTLASEIRLHLPDAPVMANPGELAEYLCRFERREMLVTLDDLERLSPQARAEALALLARLAKDAEGVFHAVGTMFPTTARAQALPASWHRLPLSPYLRLDAVRRILTTVTDYTGLRFEPVSGLDRLLYLSGGHVGLLHRLVWELFQALGEREPGVLLAVKEVHIEQAAKSLGDYHEIRRTLDLLAEDPTLRIALGALLIEVPGHTAEGAGLDTLWNWALEAGASLDLDAFEAALGGVAELGLALRNGALWRLPPAGAAKLLLEAVADPLTYLQQATR
jgi:hypothetical protein